MRNYRFALMIWKVGFGISLKVEKVSNSVFKFLFISISYIRYSYLFTFNFIIK